MTDVAGRRALPACYEKVRVHFSPPGKNNEDCFENNGLSETFDPWLQQRPCFLFMGPPSMIRGVLEMLDAFDRAAEKHPDICLVCLFRPDSRLDNDDSS
jgi:glycosyltransferase involved in cell wall biosynthesis